MSCNNPMDRGPQGPVCPAGEDAQTQRAVLAIVLAEHPAQLTCPELVRELGGDASVFAARDDAERAVRDLAGVGLLHRHGAFVTPTRAALRFEGLTSGGQH
jgi:hypothetical protein